MTFTAWALDEILDLSATLEGSLPVRWAKWLEIMGNAEKRTKKEHSNNRAAVLCVLCATKKKLLVITQSGRPRHDCRAESQPAVVLPPQLLIQVDLIRFHFSY